MVQVLENIRFRSQLRNVRCPDRQALKHHIFLQMHMEGQVDNACPPFADLFDYLIGSVDYIICIKHLF